METPNDARAAVYLYKAPSYRWATADEVAAAENVNSPALREPLGFLASPRQAIENAVARLYLPEGQASLLTDALTLAWKTVLDWNRPAWQRTEVLVSSMTVIGFIGLLLWAGRG